MKNLFLFGLIILSSSVYAQSSKLSLGFQTGAGISNADLFEPGIGHTGLLICKYDWTEIISTNIGFGYETRRTNENLIVTDNQESFIADLEIIQGFHYLTFPLLVRANIGSKIKYFINAGPSFNYLIRQSSHFGPSLLPKTNNDNYDLRDSNNTSLHKRFELDLTIGGGVEFPIKERLSLLSEVRNNIGLTNLSKVDGATSKTRSLNLLLGLTYRL